MNPESTKSGFIGQINNLINFAGPAGILIICFGVITILLLGVLGKRKLLIGLYLISVMFSGFSNVSIDSGFRLFRWLVMFVLATTIIRGFRFPGKSVFLLGLVALYGIFLAPNSPIWFFSFQLAFLSFIFTFGIAPAMSDSIRSDEDIYSTMKFILLAASIWVILGLASLGAIRQGERFSGAMTGASTFVMTGGMLLPAALWGIWSFQSRAFRYYCGIIFILILLLCILSGQRTGTFAGVIACFPLLLRFKAKQIIGVSFLALLLIAVIMISFSIFSSQEYFIKERFLSASTTGRDKLWSEAFEMCRRDPWIGHGWGTDFARTTTFHNMYLSVWYTGGIFSLIVILLSMLFLFIDAFRLQLRVKHDPIKNLGRYAMGTCLGIAAASFFEGTLQNPSDIIAFTFIYSGVVVSRCLSMTSSKMIVDNRAYLSPEAYTYASENPRSAY